MGLGEEDVWEGPAWEMLAYLYRASSCSKGMLASSSRSASSAACNKADFGYNKQVSRFDRYILQMDTVLKWQHEAAKLFMSTVADQYRLIQL